MDRQSWSAFPAEDHAATTDAMRAQQEATHLTNLPWTVAGSMVAGLLLMAALWRVIPARVLLGWLAVLMVVLGARLASAAVHRAQLAAGLFESERDFVKRWLLRHRIGFFVHGCTWGAACTLPVPQGDYLHQAVLIVMLVIVAMGSFTVTTFDMAAGLAFGVPVLSVLGIRLLTQNDPSLMTLGIAALIALAYMTLTARRAHRYVRGYVALRVAEAKQAQALRESEELLERTGVTASVGGWEYDVPTKTVRLTRQVHLIHDVDPAVRLGTTALYSHYGAKDQATIRAAIDAALTDGTAFDLELPLTTSKGRARWVRVLGQPQRDDQGRIVRLSGAVQDVTQVRAADVALQAASEALAQKSQILQLTLDSINQGIVSMNADNRATVYNRRMLELLDLPESLFGPDKTFDDVVRFQTERGDFGEGHAYIDPQTRRFIATNDNERVPDHYVRRTRTGGHLEVRTRWLPDGSWVRTYADVSAYFEAQRALRDSESQLRAMLGMFPGYIGVANGRLEYTYVNDRLAQLIGRPREQIIGSHVRDVLGEKRYGELRAFWAGIPSGEPRAVESFYPATATRPPTWLHVTHALDGDGERRTYYAFGIDISARKAAETALIAAKEEAERANRAKSQFVSSMSHELRTPMNAILGFGQLLAEDTASPLSRRHRGYVHEILRGGQHLLSLINEVLDLAQVETGKLRISLEPVCLADVLNECLGLLQPIARDSGIAIEVTDAPAPEWLVQADRTRLKQVLLNLLSNAIKYNRTDGRVDIACSAGADAVRVAIRDTGPGLDAEQHARLFQAFERLDAGRTSVEGAGLGLVLSKRLIDAMRGEIGLASEVGIGSTFWIRLPRAAEPQSELGAGFAPSTVTSAAALADGATRTVLYIEDNPVNVLLMEAMLARVPALRLITAPLPGLGLQLARDEQPDLILLDIQLPGMDGYEVLRRLRASGGAGASVPVIAVSANAMPPDVERGIAAGFVDYLTKPVDMQRLIAAVEAALVSA